MKTYRCKHNVEALRWMDTDVNREVLAAWFEKHNAVFKTFGTAVVLPKKGVVTEGQWILFSDGEFLVRDDEMFTDIYEVIA